MMIHAQKHIACALLIVLITFPSCQRLKGLDFDGGIHLIRSEEKAFRSNHHVARDQEFHPSRRAGIVDAG